MFDDLTMQSLSHAHGETKASQGDERDSVEGHRDVVNEGEFTVKLGQSLGRLALATKPIMTYLGASNRLALRALEAVTAVDEVLNLRGDHEPIEKVGDQARNDKDALDTLLDLVPVRCLQGRRQQHRVEVEMGEEERAGQQC